LPDPRFCCDTYGMVDVIPGRFATWSPGDVPGERIDQDVPVAALEALEWRP